jgi:hypothetical protein
MTRNVVYRWNGQGWSRLGEPVTSRSGIAALGSSSSQSIPDLLVESTGQQVPARTVYHLKNGHWIRVGATIDGVGIGPNTSGPVHVSGQTWLSVNEANSNPWRAQVFRRVSADGPWSTRTLNVGPGSAQGWVFAAGDSVWAIWIESVPRSDGPFPFNERIFAERVDETPSRATLLHAGLSVGPGDAVVTAGAGRTWALYMRSTRSQGMQVDVRALADDED